LRDLLWHLDVHAREHVALAVALETRSAAALDAQQLSVLGAGRDLQRHQAFGCRHLDLASERNGRERHGHVDDEIVAAPFVDLRRLNARDHVEVAGGRAAVPRLALALQLDTRPVLDARGDLHRVALRAALAAGAVTRRARRLDDRAHAAAARARLLQREEAL